MHVHRVMVAGLSAVSLAGCAGPSAFHEIRRLRADVGLLDQRVTQLERASVQGPHASAWPGEPQMPISVPPVVKPPATAYLDQHAPTGEASAAEPLK